MEILTQLGFLALLALIIWANKKDGEPKEKENSIHQNKERLCEYCGNPIPRNSSRWVYCSQDCADEAKKQRDRKYHKKQRKKKKEKEKKEENGMVECVFCGTMFRAKNPKARYCDNCRDEVARIYARGYNAGKRKILNGN